MIIQRVNRTDAEKIFIAINNVDADSITTGMGVRLIGGAAAEIVSTDGVQGIKVVNDATMMNFAGIAAQDIASGGVGLVQCWGYVNSVLLSAEANKTIGVTGIANSYLKVGAVAGSFTSTMAPETLSTFGGKSIVCWSTTNISGGLNYGKGFVRAL